MRPNRQRLSIALFVSLVIIFIISKSTDGGETWMPVVIFPAAAGGTIGTVNAIAVDPVAPSNVYVGATRGFYKSGNSGGSFTLAGNGLPSPSISAQYSRIAVSRSDPMTLYVLVGNGQIFKTTNGGGNWTQLITLALGATPFSQQPLPFAVAPNNPDVVYVGSRDRGIYKSISGGAAWTAINNGLVEPRVNAVAIDPSASATLYAATAGFGVFKSTDGGANWNTVNTGLNNQTVAALAVDPSNATRIFAGTLAGSDAFVARLNATGTQIGYFRLLAGYEADLARGIAVDGSGSAYVAGSTASPNFPTQSPIQPGYAGSTDGFVTKINPQGSALVYSTYLGGGGLDEVFGIGIDGAGAAVVAGRTASPNFPVASPLRRYDPNAIGNDAFVTKLNPQRSGFVYSTYLGGSRGLARKGERQDRLRQQPRLHRFHRAERRLPRQCRRHGRDFSAEHWRPARLVARRDEARVSGKQPDAGRRE